MKSYLFLLLLFSVVWQPGIAQITTDENIRISILTCAPGQELYSIYGHNAIRIIDRNNGTDLVYNYGTFDFNTPGFALKFMRGKLPYMLSVADYYDFLEEYHYFRRSVTEQELYLDPVQKKKIVDYLAVNMQPENRAYKYDFFMDNCATRLRDILQANVTGLQWDESRASRKTFRQMIKEYQKGMPWTNFGIDLIIGSPADRKTNLAEEAFLPDYLSTAITYAHYDDPRQTGLQFKQSSVLSFKKNALPNAVFLSPWFLFGLLLLVEMILLYRNMEQAKDGQLMLRYDQVWVIVIALSSLLMLFMWFGTDHIPTKYNWNVLWATPAIPVWWLMRKNLVSSWGKGLTVIILVSLVLSIINALPGMQVLPQYFHPIVMMIGAILLIKGYRIYRNMNHLA